MNITTVDDSVPPRTRPPRANDGWLRYSAERAASLGMLLVIATIAAVAKHRAYRMLLGAALVSANLALALALIARWGRPASGTWGLFTCCAITLTTAIILAALSMHGAFVVNE
jgi:uncharacterized membrane protein